MVSLRMLTDLIHSCQPIACLSNNFLSPLGPHLLRLSPSRPQFHPLVTSSLGHSVTKRCGATSPQAWGRQSFGCNLSHQDRCWYLTHTTILRPEAANINRLSVSIPVHITFSAICIFKYSHRDQLGCSTRILLTFQTLSFYFILTCLSEVLPMLRNLFVSRSKNNPPICLSVPFKPPSLFQANSLAALIPVCQRFTDP